MTTTTLALLLLATSVSSFTVLLRPASHHCLTPAAATRAFGRASLPIVMCAAEGEGAAPADDAEEPVASELTEDEPNTAAVEEEEEEDDDLLSTPAFLKQKLKVLEKELAEVQEKTVAAKAAADEVEGEWGQKQYRLQTDFDNFKKRHVNQTLEAQLDARIKVLNEFLPVLDNFDRARASISAEGEAQEATNALYTDMHSGLMSALTELDMEKIECVGSEFDYNLHMAIQQIPSEEYEEGTVCAEMQPGYTCKGKLLRPAYVAVAL